MYIEYYTHCIIKINEILYISYPTAHNLQKKINIDKNVSQIDAGNAIHLYK